ncbi:MAG: GNAT family N-acetyltransferase [Actinomycetota bacterium]
MRRARPEDGPAMGLIHVDAHRAAYRGMMPDEHLDSLDPELRGRWWTERLTAGGGEGRCPTRGGLSTVLVAEAGGRILGIASVGEVRPDPVEGVGELWMLNIAPDAWGRGLGRLLLAAATDELRDRGFREAVLWVVERNQRARRFYEDAGWGPDGGVMVEDTRGSPIREVRYRRRLEGDERAAGAGEGGR